MALIYKIKTRWYIFNKEGDYPNKKLVPFGFPSRKAASGYIEGLNKRGE